jgi:DNA-binding helix-hairpin-helix protein with protein kinase domain
VCRKADLDSTKVVVERDINAALAAIHAQGFAFVDVHPGNILMSANGERAMLIDIESMSPLGVPVDNETQTTTLIERKA